MIRKLYFLLIFFSFFSTTACEDLAIDEDVGCLSGIFPGTNNRTYLFCITRAEFATTGNTFNGNTYDNVIWTEVNDCDECITLDYSQL